MAVVAQGDAAEVVAGLGAHRGVDHLGRVLIITTSSLALSTTSTTDESGTTATATGPEPIERG